MPSITRPYEPPFDPHDRPPTWMVPLAALNHRRPLCWSSARAASTSADGWSASSSSPPGLDTAHDIPSAACHLLGMADEVVQRQSAAYWRERAEEVRLMAASIRDPTSKRIMADIVASYDQLAELTDRMRRNR